MLFVRRFFFLFLALAAIMCSGEEIFDRFLVTSQGTILSSFVEICPVVMAEMLFEVFFYLFLALAAILCSGAEIFEKFR